MGSNDIILGHSKTLKQTEFNQNTAFHSQFQLSGNRTVQIIHTTVEITFQLIETLFPHLLLRQMVASAVSNL